MDNSASSEQVDPVKTSDVRIVDEVMDDVKGRYGYSTLLAATLCDDLLSRAEVGFKRYGTYLAPFNGRSNLLDAYQENLDLIKYLRNEIWEHPEDVDLKWHYHQMIDTCAFLCKRIHNLYEDK